MIINPISIASRGVYANDLNTALATSGYVDQQGGPITSSKQKYVGMIADVGRMMFSILLGVTIWQNFI